jgi:hypothetical protein
MPGENRAEKKIMPTENGTKTQRWLIFVAVIALVALLATHWQLQRLNVPAELIGTWKTATPQYADRSLEISHHSITFATGPGTESTGFIDDIEATANRDGALYTISYSANGEHQHVSFYYSDVDGKKSIHFKNQQGIVWLKDKSS